MRWTQIKLYSITAPLVILPMLGFSFSQIDDYIKGTEFRTLAAEVVSGLLGSVFDFALIAAITGGCREARDINRALAEFFSLAIQISLGFGAPFSSDFLTP